MAHEVFNFCMATNLGLEDLWEEKGGCMARFYPEARDEEEKQRGIRASPAGNGLGLSLFKKLGRQDK